MNPDGNGIVSGLALEEMAGEVHRLGGPVDRIPIASPARALFMLTEWYRMKPPWWRPFARREWRRFLNDMLSRIEFERAS